MKFSPFQHLLQPYERNSFSVKNRVVLAPLTRCMATDEQVPTENMKRFYTNRSSCGLLITEATCISPDANAYPNTPGIYSAPQIEHWKEIASEVQGANAKFFLQLWHSGMLSHSSYAAGKRPLSPSGIKPQRALVPRLRVPYETPVVMTENDIEEVKEKFCQAAFNAVVKAGFDGVELHGANGYLIDTFMHHETNKRQDRYGGTPENMSRFLLELVDDIAKAVGGYHKVAVRLSPVTPPGMESMNPSPDDAAVYVYALNKLSELPLAYVHMSSDDDEKDCGFLGSSVSAFMRKHYSGTFIAGGNYDLHKGEQSISENKADLIYFGKILIANPHLIDALKHGRSDLTPFDFSMVSNPP